MADLGTEEHPLRVAIIGSGPAGFYAASNLLKYKDIVIKMDMYERLPTPFGLVRAGVAPDHQKYKSVTRAYDKSAAHDNFRFYGNITYGEDIRLADLKKYYHQVVFTTGAQADRSLNIPGESLAGSHSATDFVAWYNGHPDFVDYEFDLKQAHVVIVGLGNVAVDVARILCKTPEELAGTDIADYALAALSQSQVKTVTVLGRRGPAQAAFTPPEIKEMGQLDDADVTVLLDEARIDEASQHYIDGAADKNVKRNVEIITRFSEWQASAKSKHFSIRFLVSPTELIGDAAGHVQAVKIVKNESYVSENGEVKARVKSGGADAELLKAGLVFRSVGYKGVALVDIPFDEQRCIVFNTQGRVQNEHGELQRGLYVAGWIKRGPSGVIGTNKTDAQETVSAMIEDFRNGVFIKPEKPGLSSVRDFIFTANANTVTFKDWREIDTRELRKGIAFERPRVKFTNVEDMLDVLER